MTDAQKQPSFLRGLGIIALSYLVTWHLAFLVLWWPELMESPREFFQVYATGAQNLFSPLASPHDGGAPAFVQLPALAVGLMAAIFVLVHFAWKRPRDND